VQRSWSIQTFMLIAPWVSVANWKEFTRPMAWKQPRCQLGPPEVSGRPDVDRQIMSVKWSDRIALHACSVALRSTRREVQRA
jgi:hypothetical protein